MSAVLTNHLIKFSKNYWRLVTVVCLLARTYNIPVCLWLLDTHPYNPPMIYVKPTANMQIKPGRHVDMSGRIYLPYLHEWKHVCDSLLYCVLCLWLLWAKCVFLSLLVSVTLPSVLWCCWLGSRKGIRPVKIWVLRYWRGYLSGARCEWFAYGPADATATPSSLAPVKSRMVYFSGAGLPRLSWKKAVKQM